MTRRELPLVELLRLREHLEQRKLERDDWALLSEIVVLMRQDLEAEGDAGHDKRESDGISVQLSRR